MKSFRCGPLVKMVINLAPALALASCGSTPPPVVGLVNNKPVAEYGQAGYTDIAPQAYLLRASDVISISVYREEDLSVENVPIGADGNVSVPYIGTLKAEGLTAVTLAQQIADRLQGTLKHPRVNVNVMQYASHVVTVEGSVAKPGVYPFKPGARLSAAIALASGPSRVAKLQQVAIFRETPEGLMVAKFDYVAVRQGTMLDPVLNPNDRVVVGTSGLSQFWQDLLVTLPAFALFTRI